MENTQTSNINRPSKNDIYYS
jgi:hypothetical protein